MERDYFKDRPIEYTQKNKLPINSEAFICLKENQKTAKELSDLTRIQITSHLTSKSEHPCGIKLKGIMFKRDIDGNILTNEKREPIYMESVGRCVYPMVSGQILTKDGFKSIFREGNKLCISTISDEMYNLIITFTNGETYFDACLNPYQFYTEEQLYQAAIALKISEGITNGGYIYTSIKNSNIMAKIIKEYGKQYSPQNIKITPIEFYGLHQ